MGKKVTHIGLKFIGAFLGVLLLGAIPGLFDGMNLTFSGYVNRLFTTIDKLIHYEELTFRSGDEIYQLFPTIFEYLTYSLVILFGALALSFLVGFLLTYITLHLPAPLQKVFRRIAFIVESLPDVCILAMVQIAVIWIYKKTNILVMDVAAFDRIYTMPILVLSVLPTFLFYRIMLLVFEEELARPYVTLARTKGIESSVILLFHVFRNAILSIYFHSKSIVWFALSNLFIMEFVFNLNGLIRFIYEHPTPEIFTVSALLLFIPIFIVLSIYQGLAERASKEEALL
ncbi:ABC transporter permease subunit [Pseudalkalibacillus hwajinpoensis]|uniref:ABC transporter permease subunit n=1 Tax=Guptibacillus hwajinpoensis TaxID=208199 RepID=A0A4U1MEI7_9BACL|nr:ABC transporter permease subunit [Pseudalkalibacillus hwajinpoensis]TKD68785.1 ABC transporter permease subunit [Pseudalkalibacillus hwajinpoensis]